MTFSLTEKWPIINNWKFFVLIGLPIVLIPILFIEDNDTVPEGDSTRASTVNLGFPRFKSYMACFVFQMYKLVQ